jgi:hypothetical protein
MTSIKECPTCGAQNDLIFTNCIYCKSSLPELDHNSLSNEELIMKASEWVGKSMDTFLIIKEPDANEWTGKGVVIIRQPEIIGNAEKYVNILAIRGLSNPTVALMCQDLKNKLEKNSKSGPRKIRILVGGSLGISFLMMFVFFWGSKIDNIENNKNKENERLNKIELQINDAIKNKDYDNALILSDQLVWKSDLSNSKKEVEQHEKQRENLKQSILKFKEQTNKQ